MSASCATSAESIQFQFGAEYFSVLNHNFGDPNASVTNGAFGRVTSALDPRIGQLSQTAPA
jgi:hypothetical protein